MSTLSHPQTALGARPICFAKGTIGDMACFLIPALAFLRMELGGVLYATDVCLLAVFPFVVFRHRRWLQIKPIRKFLYLGLLWLAAQVLTDIMRHSPFEDYSRGWSKILLTLTHFATIALLIRQSQRRLILYGAGMILGGVLTFFISSGVYAAVYPWKFGLGPPITLLVCLVAGMLARRRQIAAVTMLAAIGAINLFLGFRSLGAICAAAAIYSYFQLSSRLADSRLRKRRMVLTIAVLAAGEWGISAIYAHGAQSGWFGGVEREKYEIQSSGAGGILLGGRSAFLASSVAIIDSPLLGHGSWAKDPMYKALLFESMAELGYENMGDEYEDDLIPSHSYLFGAWVEAGIVGAVFWFWVLWLAARALMRASGREPLLPFFAFIGMLLIWNVLFSPYGADARFTATYFVYAMFLFALHTEAQKRTDAYG
jgi:O-Antigen ligase